MANPRSAWGIDIGNRAFKAVKLVREGDALRIDDFEFIEHETLLSEAGDNKEQLIQTALANFTQRHMLKNTPVSIGVSGQNSFARFVKLPPVEDKKIPEIVRFEAIQQIPFPLDDVEWSYQLFRQDDNPEVEVGIFAMRKELVNQHIKHFTDFDLNVQNVQMNPLAVYNALQYDGRFDDGIAMVVDVGTDNTDLLIASAKSIWMRSIPIGGSSFTDALVKAFKLNFVKAEQLKREAATSKYARQIFQHMRPVFADLVAEIQRSIGFYASVNRDAKINKIFALGGTFKLPGLQKYLQQNLQLPVERIDSLASGAPADARVAASFGDELLTIVGAYGQAVQAMNASLVTSSLLPAAIQRERMWQDKTKWFGLAAALFLTGTVVVGARWFLEDLQQRNAEGVRTKNAELLKSAQDLSTKWQQVQNFGEQERAVVANLQSLIEGKYLWRDIYVDLINSVPRPDVALEKAIVERNADAVKLVPRGQRRLIQIDEITPRYEPLLATLLADPKFRPVTSSIAGNTQPGVEAFGGFAGGPFGGMPPGMAGGMPGATPGAEGAAGAVVDLTGKGRGFIVTMRLTCPLQNAIAFIEQDLQKALMQIRPSQARPTIRYEVKKVWILQRQTIDNIPTRMQRLLTDYTASTLLNASTGTTPGGIAPGRAPGVNPFGVPPGAAFGAPGQPNPAGVIDTSPAYNDRLTGESVVNDWEFEIAVAVELDPEPWKAPEAGAPAAP